MSYNPYEPPEGSSFVITPVGFPAPKRNVDRAEALRALIGDRSVVYAVRTSENLVKIGCTSNLAVRRAQIDPKAQILGFMFGDFDDEADIHAQLREHVHHGREWYHPTAAVLSVVNEMREPFGLEPLDPASF